MSYFVIEIMEPNHDFCLIDDLEDIFMVMRKNRYWKSFEEHQAGWRSIEFLLGCSGYTAQTLRLPAEFASVRSIQENEIFVSDRYPLLHTDGKIRMIEADWIYELVNERHGEVIPNIEAWLQEEACGLVLNNIETIKHNLFDGEVMAELATRVYKELSKRNIFAISLQDLAALGNDLVDEPIIMHDNRDKNEIA